MDRWAKAGKDSHHPLPYHCLDVAAVLDVGLARRPALLDFIAAGLSMSLADTRAMLLVLLALHDIGKVSAAFQVKRPDILRRLGRVPPSRKPANWPHDAVGQMILLDRLGPSGLAALGLPLADMPRDGLDLLCAIATGHHGSPPSRGFDPRRLEREGVLAPDDLDAAKELVAAMAALFGWTQGTPDPVGLDRLSPLLNGLFTLCDWLGSSERFAYREGAMDLADYYRLHALPGAADVLDEVQPALFRQLTPRPPLSFAQMFAALGQGGSAPAPTPLQALVDRLFTARALPDGPLLVLVEDLPGSGKTEAGDLITQRLTALGRTDGTYVGLPTMATADAAYDRKFAVDGAVPFAAQLLTGTPQVVLAHSRRHRHRTFRFAATRAGLEEGEGVASAWFARSSRRALLAELGVGTVDQALAGALRARHATLRLAGLWRKLLLVDEVHAYDHYMQPLLEALLRWHGRMGDPAVLMSATLPTRIRNALIRAYAEGAGWADIAAMTERTRPGAYPLLTLVSQQGIAQHPLDPVPGPGTRPVRFEGVEDEASVDAAIQDWQRQGRSVIWFRNNVGDAVTAWKRHAEAARAEGLAPPMLYHARFLPADRAAAEVALMRFFGKQAVPDERRGRLLVTTQAAEQSLDLDADEMVIDLAPADAVIQRLGRRRRHARTIDGALAGDGVDQRPDSPVLLHTPPVSAPSKHWYARKFPRAAYIYPDDARLWLTAHHLLAPSTIPGNPPGSDHIVPARDLRPLLEAVYAEPPAAPPCLMASHETADGKAAAERQQGRQARLSFRADLLTEWHAHAGVADDPAGEPRTRLIDSHMVGLAGIVDGRPQWLSLLLHPDLPEGWDPVEESECRSPRPLICPPEEEGLAGALKSTLPEAGRRRWEALSVILLRPASADHWCGEAVTGDEIGSKRRRYTVIYNVGEGLTLTTQGQP
ncbi:CRISPR-associated helicase Cas3' [Niveispirillum fermenti]|uniref:CRISPR-associated helicase Cas3' n=1 Tax=Niveispirillum fermenti TaxID=1233113 RepID=UPI003A8B17E6